MGSGPDVLGSAFQVSFITLAFVVQGSDQVTGVVPGTLTFPYVPQRNASANTVQHICDLQLDIFPMMTFDFNNIR